MKLRRSTFARWVLALALLCPLTAGQAAPKPRQRGRQRTPLSLIRDRAQLVRLVAGKTPATKSLMSLRRAPELRLIAKKIDLLKKPGVKYERAYLGESHIALVRKGGIIDLMLTADAAAQVRSGKPVSAERVKVGIGWRGSGLYSEHGPNNTLRLYRQLPAKADGNLTSSLGLTSFALTNADAYHPFGKPGKTVTLSVPRTLFDRAVAGELGGAGWSGGGMGIDVLQEVQIDSSQIKKLAP